MASCDTAKTIAQLQADCPPAAPLGRPAQDSDGDIGIPAAPPHIGPTPDNGRLKEGDAAVEQAATDYQLAGEAAIKTIRENQEKIRQTQEVLQQWETIWIQGVGGAILPIAEELDDLFGPDADGIASLFMNMQDFSKFMESLARSSESADRAIDAALASGFISEADAKQLKEIGAKMAAVGEPIRDVANVLSDGVLDPNELQRFGNFVANSPAGKATIEFFRGIGQAASDAVSAFVRRVFPGYNEAAMTIGQALTKMGEDINQTIANANAAIDFTNDCFSLANEFFQLTNGLLQAICQTINAVRQLLTYMSSLTKYSVLFAFAPIAAGLLQVALPQLRLPGNVTLLLTNVDGLRSHVANTLKNSACIADAITGNKDTGNAARASANSISQLGSLKSVSDLVTNFVNDYAAKLATGLVNGLATSVLAIGQELPPGIEPPTGLAWTLSSKGPNRELTKRVPVAPEKGNLLSAVQGIITTISYGAKLFGFFQTMGSRLNNSWLAASYRGVAVRPDGSTELLGQATITSELGQTNNGLDDLAKAGGACGVAAEGLGTHKDEKAGRAAVAAALQACGVALAHGGVSTRPDGTNPSQAALDKLCCEDQKPRPIPDPEDLKKQMDEILGKTGGGGNPTSPTTTAGDNNGGGDDGDEEDPEVPVAPPAVPPTLPSPTFPGPTFGEDGRLTVPGLDGGLGRPEDAVAGSNSIRPFDLVENPFLGFPPGFHDPDHRAYLDELAGGLNSPTFQLEEYLLALLTRNAGELNTLRFITDLFKKFDKYNFTAGFPAYSLLTKATNQGLRTDSPYTVMVEGATAVAGASANGVELGAVALVDWLRHGPVDFLNFSKWLTSLEEVDLEVPIPSDLTQEEWEVAQESFSFFRDNLDQLRGVESFMVMLRRRADAYGGFNAFEHIVVVAILHLMKYLKRRVQEDLSLEDLMASVATLKRLATRYLTNPDIIMPVLEGLTR